MTSSHKKNDTHTRDDSDVRDVAVGSVESIDARGEQLPWTWKTFQRSVLLQMILFGLSVSHR
jgi:hypothetical protein